MTKRTRLALALLALALPCLACITLPPTHPLDTAPRAIALGAEVTLAGDFDGTFSVDDETVLSLSETEGRSTILTAVGEGSTVVHFVDSEAVERTVTIGVSPVAGLVVSPQTRPLLTRAVHFIGVSMRDASGQGLSGRGLLALEAPDHLGASVFDGNNIIRIEPTVAGEHAVEASIDGVNESIRITTIDLDDTRFFFTVTPVTGGRVVSVELRSGDEAVETGDQFIELALADGTRAGGFVQDDVLPVEVCASIEDRSECINVE